MGSFLASFFQVLFNKLISLALGYAQREGISIALLKEWNEMLVTINVVLTDAEDKQLSCNHPVKLWLDDVRDLAYDMEDLLDEFAIKAAQVESEAGSSTSRGLEKWKLSFFGRDKSSGSNPNLRSPVSETKVQEIDGRLKAIVTRKACLSLRESVANGSNYSNKRDPTTSLPERQFIGREKEEAKILELLISEVENFSASLSIVPIVGMGGVGKTALAQRLYNDARVYSYFEIRAWVCVSDVFDVVDITKTILRSITGSSCEGEDLNSLQVKLKDKLSGKKFLVVLDDIWNEKYEKWTALLKPFETGAKGSKIIVTTRNLDVVSITGASPYPLKELSLDNWTSLLAFHALGATNFEGHPDFEIVGKKIAERCKGLPLAAKMLGGVLRTKRNLDEWEDALNNEIWDLPTAENDEVLRVLKLSYVHLPSYLKRCFAYCAVFPKDYEIERDELVLLWIAEGFLDGQKAKENNLRLGRDYFEELVSKSFLQQSSVDTSKFSMHVLLNDLAKSIAGGTCFTSGESHLAGNEDAAYLEKVRYASCILSGNVTSKSLRAQAGMKGLRSLMLHGHGSKKFSISNKVLHDLLTKLKYLRVFSLRCCSIIEGPNCIGDLQHLRFLNFSYTDIERLPESIGALLKLQTLILRGCQKLSMLPRDITSLSMLPRYLTHLEITDCPELEVECFPPLPTTLLFFRLDSCPKIKSLPNQWHHLTSLQRLEIGRCQNIKCLPKGGLPPNLLELRISECENLNRPVREWGLNMLASLKTLLIDLSMAGEGKKVWFPSEDEDAWSLMFPSSLTSLYIKNMRNGERLSSGLRNHLPSLERLWIEDCPKLRYLPEDGFPPSLQELHVLRRKILKD